MAGRGRWLDLYQIEHSVVRIRNLAHFLVQSKDSRDARKIFVVGHPRTGTLTLHKIFETNGLRSRHSPGLWPTAEYDCFSDRGNFHPYTRIAEYYTNSLFILNTRPVYNYIRSIIHHRFGRGNRSSGWFDPSVRNIENEIAERNKDFMKFINYFHHKTRFLVINIEKEGALDFLCDQTGLRNAEPENKPRRRWRDQDLDKIEQAFQNLGIEEEKKEPFVLESLLSSPDKAALRDFRNNHADRLYL